MVILLFGGCESGDNLDFGSRAPTGQSEGLVQARTDEDGTVRVAMVLAPKKPGGEAPDVSELRGVDLFDRSVIPSANSETEVRGRALSSRSPGYPGVFLASAQHRRLEDDTIATVGTSEYNPGGGGVNSTDGGGPDLDVGYASSAYVAFDHYIDFTTLPGERQTVTFSHGPLEGTAEIFRANGTLYARVNGGEPTVVTPLRPSQTLVYFGMILPLYCGLTPKNIDRAALDQLVGVWNVSAAPEFTDQFPGFPDFLFPYDPGGGAGVGATPFDFTLKALVVEDVDAEYNADITDPETGDVFSGGATFTAVAKFIEGKTPPTTDHTFLNHTRMVLKAQVFSDGGSVIRTLYKEVPFLPAPNRSRDIEVVWDGNNNAGNPAPGDTVYGVAITAMLAGPNPSGLLLERTNGYIFNITPGVGPDGVTAAFLPGEDNELRIEPAGYYPYTDAEINNYWEGPLGDLVWRDNTGDGIPDFPDHDGDGNEDFGPGEAPPPVEITASIDKRGYNTTWTLRAYKKVDGTKTEVTEEYQSPDGPSIYGPPPWTGDEEVYIEWIPPGNLGDAEVTLELEVTRCRSAVDLQILGQGEGEVCTPGDPIVVALAEPRPELVLFTFKSMFSTQQIKSSDPPDKDAIEALRTISKNWSLELQNLATDSIPDAVDPVKVSFDLSKTLNPDIFEGTEPLLLSLPHGAGAPEAGPYDFPLSFNLLFFEEHDVGAAKRGFTIVDATPSGGFFESELVQKFLAPGTDGPKNVLLGRSEVGGDPLKIVDTEFPPSDVDNVVDTERSVFFKAGFEVGELRADDPAAPELAKEKLNIKVRLHNQAPLLFYRGKIRQPENVMELGTGTLSANSAVNELTDWKRVRTVVLSAPNALNLGNMGNTSAGRKSFAAANSGRPWAFGMMWRGVDRILGYNGEVPRNLSPNSFESRAFKKFLDLLNTRFYRDNSAGLDETALAWIYGHVSTPIAAPYGQSGELGPDRVTSVAAYTRRNYLFIYESTPPGTLAGPQTKGYHYRRTLLAVPPNLWYKDYTVPTLIPVQFAAGAQVPQTLSQLLAEPFAPPTATLENVYDYIGVKKIDEF